MTKIKICGLKRPEDIRAVNEAQPDFAGFVIEVSKSRRNVSVEQVRELAKGLSEQIQAVGVFVNAPLDLVAGLLNDGTLALAQLHGSEDEAYIRQLRQMIDKPLLQAFSIRTEADGNPCASAKPTLCPASSQMIMVTAAMLMTAGTKTPDTRIGRSIMIR